MVTRRRTESSRGKMPTTSVRRRISLFRRSKGLVERIWRQWRLGEGHVDKNVLLGLPGALGGARVLGLDEGDGLVVELAGLRQAGLHEGHAEGRNRETLDFGRGARRFRRKGTVQRCQAVPLRTARIAARRPVWASEMTSFTGG